MSIKWRLYILFLGLIISFLFNYFLFGTFIITEAWFIVGVLMLLLNPLLNEIGFAKPKDVILNSVVFFSIYFTSSIDDKLAFLWSFSAYTILFFFLAAIIATIGGANKRIGSILSQPANILSRLASSKLIYSIIILFGITNTYEAFTFNFNFLIIEWLTLLLITSVNWKTLWETTKRDTFICNIEGVISPSLLNISSTRLPENGKEILFQKNEKTYKGKIIKRVRKLSGVWAQVLIFNTDELENLITGQIIRILPAQETQKIVGVVDEGSNEKELRFVSTRNLKIGNVVGVFHQEGIYILYQISNVEIINIRTKGGESYANQVRAIQLGFIDAHSKRLKKHKWTPALGGAVTFSPIDYSYKKEEISSNLFDIGNILDTRIPIFIDKEVMNEGHLAILGMTKMGKSTFTEKLIHELKSERNISILDQTGEYVNKKGFPKSGGSTNWDQPSVSVIEPKSNEIPAVRALACFNFILGKAVSEYSAGNCNARSIIMEEAHQFIPEPAGLGFGTLGRDESIQTGLLMMQIRKYNISAVIISQRTAVISKSALSQCENFIVFRSVDQTGLDYIENVAGFNVRNLIGQLDQGEALVFGPAFSSENPVVVKLHH